MPATKELSELITQSVIDSRDIIERLNELEAFDSDDHEPPTITNEEKEELSVLKAFAEEVEGYCVDFIHGESLIAEDYFVQYTKELVADCYELPKDMESGVWPYNNLKMDWEGAAEDLKVDYTETELTWDGVTITFLYR